MNACTRFDQWLDAGSPTRGAASAREHARTCARCGSAWRAMEAVEDLLAREADAPAPAGMAATVMARVAVTPQIAPVPPSVWMRRVLREPSVIGSLALAVLLVWQAGRLAHLATSVAGLLAQGATTASTWPVPAALGDPRVVAGLGMALVLPLAWVWVLLYRESERLARIPFVRR